MESVLNLISDPKHPKRKGSIVFKIVLCVMIAIGIALFAIACYYITTLKGVGGYAVVILLLASVSIVGFSIVGLVGSGFYYGNDNKHKIICLRIFWLAVFIILLILFFVGLVCIMSRDTIQYYIMMNMDSFQKVIDSLPNSAGRSSVEKVKSLVSSVVGVGITAMVVAMILLIPFCACSYVMGLQMLLETLGFCGSCVISLLGVIVIVVSVYFFVYIPITRMFSGLLLGIVVLGIFLLFLGVLGAVGYLIERKHKWPIRIFGVLLILILVAFFVLALIALQQAGSLRTTVTKGISSYCGLDGMADDEKNQNVIKASKCYEIVQSIVVYLCNGDENGILDPCPEKLKDDTQGECLCNTSLGDKVADFTKAEFFDTTVEYVVLVLEGNYKLVVLVGFLVVVLLVVMVVSVLASCCVYQKEPEGGKGGGGTSYVSDNGTGIGKGGAIGYVAYVNPTINNT